MMLSSVSPMLAQKVVRKPPTLATIRSFGNIFQRPRVVIRAQKICGFPTCHCFGKCVTPQLASHHSSSLGLGWQHVGPTFAKKKFDVRLISPSNHFLFTPLLPSTAVGTLEFRAIQEPVRIIPGLRYYQAKAMGLDTTEQTVHCQDLFKGSKYSVKYDYLVICAGNKTNTFATPGVQEREGKEVFFLTHLYHARQIRNRVLECFERASNPNISKQERNRLLSFIVVGGGPTSCEFTTELYDFLQSDVVKWYPDLVKYIKVTLVEAGPGLLGSFHQSLADYYLKILRKRKVNVRVSTAVVGIEERNFEEGDKSHYTVAALADGTEIPFATMVWSAGLAPVNFVLDSDFDMERGRIIVDDYLRIPGTKGRIFAAGDCATQPGKSLPPTASVAEQQATYLGDCFNQYYHDFDVVNSKREEEVPLSGPVYPALMPFSHMEFLNRILCKSSPMFQYKNRGSVAVIGWGDAVTDLSNSDLPLQGFTMSGWAAFLTWRGKYQLTWRDNHSIPIVIQTDFSIRSYTYYARYLHHETVELDKFFANSNVLVQSASIRKRHFKILISDLVVKHDQ